MDNKKIFVGMIVLMFIFSAIPAFIGQAEDTFEFQERKYKENRDDIPIVTKQGLKIVPAEKGKPGIYVLIENPNDGDVVSDSVEINIE